MHSYFLSLRAPPSLLELLLLFVQVFEGEFSCCSRLHVGGPHCDKEQLVIPMLGVYSRILAPDNAANDASQEFTDSTRRILNKIEAISKDIFFPPSHQYAAGKGECEEHTLFGPLAHMMESKMKGGQLAGGQRKSVWIKRKTSSAHAAMSSVSPIENSADATRESQKPQL